MNEFHEGTGADDETRTRDPHLGKVMRYQLRYIRICHWIHNSTEAVSLVQVRVKTLSRLDTDSKSPL